MPIKNIGIILFLSCCISVVAQQSTKTSEDLVKIYRPYFHFALQKNWINDPNGLVYYNNVYQLFFQYNPFGDQ